MLGRVVLMDDMSGEVTQLLYDILTIRSDFKSGRWKRLTTYETLETEGIHAEFDDLSSKLQTHTLIIHDEIINQTNSPDVVAHSLSQGRKVNVMFSGRNTRGDLDPCPALNRGPSPKLQVQGRRLPRCHVWKIPAHWRIDLVLSSNCNTSILFGDMRQKHLSSFLRLSATASLCRQHLLFESHSVPRPSSHLLLFSLCFSCT